MGARLRHLTLALLVGGLAAAVVAPPAHANRGSNPTTTTTTQPGYVPPPQYGQDPQVLPEENPYAPAPVVESTVVPVELPAVIDPGAGPAGGGDPLAPAPSAENPDVLDRAEAPPEAAPGDGFMGGILSRTGAETLPLARAGLAALVLGAGLLALARCRRTESASA